MEFEMKIFWFSFEIVQNALQNDLENNWYSFILIPQLN